MTDRPLIGLMLGDATGIGPEISVKVLSKVLASVVGNSFAESIGGSVAAFYDGWNGPVDSRIDGACRGRRRVDWVRASI